MSSRSDELLLRARRLREVADRLEALAGAPEPAAIPSITSRWVGLLHTGSVRETDVASEPVAVATSAVLAALAGDSATAHAAATRAGTIGADDRSVLAGIVLARGLAWLTDGRPAAAYESTGRMLADLPPEHPARPVIVGIFAESSIAIHQQDAARPVVDGLGTLYGPAVDRGAEELVLARALLSTDDPSLVLTRFFSDHPRSSPLLLARLNLGIGMWLRRHHNPSRSHTHLELARAQFSGRDAAPWQRALTNELRAVGIAPANEFGATRELSAQQRAIAGLAAAGLTNRQIAERLYLSPRTVSSHLYRMFPRLGVTSRSQLAGRWREWMLAEKQYPEGETE